MRCVVAVPGRICTVQWRSYRLSMRRLDIRRLGIVGHRELNPAGAEFVAAESLALLDAERTACGDVVAVSALAEGADTLFAEAALGLGLPLEIVRPFACYENDFRTEASRSRYAALVEAAARETRLPFAACSLRAYEAAMRWIADTCDLLVAAWDGLPPRSRGGTADAIRYAESIGRSVVHLDVVTHRVVLHEAAAR